MLALLLGGLLPAAAAAAAAAGCATAADCGLAGVCAAGRCRCDPWASGPRCTQLNARPAKTSRALYRPEASSWGGSVVAGAGGKTWHMYASSFINSCGFSAWEHNSEVVHATAESPEGPFSVADVARPPWTHNPTVSRSNGTLVLFHLGASRPNGLPKTNCSHGVTHGHTARQPQLLRSAAPPPAPLLPAVSWAGSPSGPWRSAPGTRDGWGLNNPAAHFLPNGSVFMLYKAGCDEDPGGHSFCRQFAVANCVNFTGPCTQLRKIPVYGEDAGLFRDKRGAFHIFFHGGNYAPCLKSGTCNYTGPTCRRFHHGAWNNDCYFHTAWSANGLEWQMDKTTQPFNWTIELEGGGSVTYADRARHQVLLDGDGELSHVYGGVRRDDATDFTLTAVQPVHTSKTLQQ